MSQVPQSQSPDMNRLAQIVAVVSVISVVAAFVGQTMIAVGAIVTASIAAAM